MRLSLQQKVSVGFATALLVVSAIGGASYLNVWRLLHNRQQVEHTYRVLNTLERLSSRLAITESRARGYFLTGDSLFLQRYRDGESAAAAELVTVRELTADNPREAVRITRLEQLTASRSAMLGQDMRLRHERGSQGSLPLTRTGEGIATMDSIRHVIAGMESDEAALLRQRTSSEQASVRTLTIAVALGVFVAFVISILADAVIRRDMAERTRAEEAVLKAKEAAEAASQSKSDFLARMSHELRTPLNSVIGFANVLLKNKSGNLQQQELSYLARILANGRELLALINDVLDLSKIEAGKVELTIAPVAVGTLVLDVIAQFEEAIHGRPLTLRTAFPTTMLPLDTDPGKLAQVLKNLVGNALKFTQRGCVTITVHVEPETARPVCIDVTDTGIGIPLDRQGAVFKAFEQADSGTAREYGGTGLGLAISRSLCHLMGYELEVASEPERGSIFSVLLAPTEPLPVRSHVAGLAGAPLAAEPPAPGAGWPEHDGRGVAPLLPSVLPVAIEGQQVLVIDDNPDARELLTRHIEELGSRAVAAGSAAEGLRLARNLRPDLILLDLIMPEVSGWELLQQLKAEADLRDIPVIIVSIVAEEQRGQLPGAADLIGKPVSPDALSAAVRSCST